MSIGVLGPAMPALERVLASLAGAAAHEVAGNRFFPATLSVDDPGVNDELAVPTISMTKSGDEPPVKELDFSGEYAKRITEAFAISTGPTWTHLFAPGGPPGTAAGAFQNLDTTFSTPVSKEPTHPLLLSARLSHASDRTAAP